VECERITADLFCKILKIGVEIAPTRVSSLFQADLLEQVGHEVLEVGPGGEFGVCKRHQDHHEKDGLAQPGCPRLQQGKPDSISQLLSRRLSVLRGHPYEFKRLADHVDVS